MIARHTSPFCGSWYPGQAPELRRLLTSLEETSEERTGSGFLPSPLAFVVPHAGLAYSGAVAQAAFRYLRHSPPERVWLLGFSHSGACSAVATTDVAAYCTPLGDVQVDSQKLPFPRLQEARLCDHSVEIQLPLLRSQAPGAHIIPLYVGCLSPAERRRAAQQLANLYRPGDVFVASSDFTHFGRNFGYVPFPVDTSTAQRIADLDQRLIDAAASVDAGYFLSEIDRTESTTCGREPIALLLETLSLLPGVEVFQVALDYQTSGQLTGDFSHSVSYAALGYFPAESFTVPQEEQRLLLQSAFDTLSSLYSTGERRPVPPALRPAAFQRRIGAFVTLYQNDELRGCIGHMHPVKPLGGLIPELTLSAALDDPRFSHSPLPPAETRVEISLLTPPKPVADVSGFVLHRHGAMLEQDHHRGLLLPQVAHEYHLTREQFLHALARKAGLDWERLKPDYRLAVFRSTRFSAPV
jgi:AmmeMemoRadiSam system protein B/AmmeMemoRadiSam system protein A